MSKPERRSALHGHLAPGHHGAVGHEPVTLREITRDAAEISLRRDQEGRHDGHHHENLQLSAKNLLGLELPVMGRSTSHGQLTALGIAPGIWTIMAAPAAPGSLATRLSTALGTFASVVETGHGQVMLELAGANARHVMSKGCRLDLHPSAFQPGQVARTIIAQIPVTLWQVDAQPTFALAVPMTFAQSFVHFLLAASAESGCTILPASRD